VNLTVGTDFFHPARAGIRASDADGRRFPAAGHQQVCAGFALYGPSTMLVLTTGEGVDGFTLDRDIGAFILTHPKMRIPGRPANSRSTHRTSASGSRRSSAMSKNAWPGKTGPRGKDFNMRWIASLVAETLRILTRGGVFMYPGQQGSAAARAASAPDVRGQPDRLLIEQAGGEAPPGASASSMSKARAACTSACR
jgi:fructose-1,6-bisphosphatase